MKLFNNIFESITSTDNLFSAWEVFKRDKLNKLDVAKFERNIEKNIFEIQRELKEKTYKHGGYSGFYIYDPKKRHIHKAAVRDRILHHAVFRVLNPIFEPTFISHSFSCRVGKGTHKGVEALSNMLRKVSKNNTRPCYALKCDVRKFFDSVDQKILMEILERRIKDPNCLWLLKEIVGSYETGAEFRRERERERERESTFLRSGKGIPIGNLTSQLFANIYMNEFDQFVKHVLKVKNYVRYTDDFIIVSGSKDYLNDQLSSIHRFLSENLKLELHPNKITIRKFNRGIDFLGYVILPHYQIVRTKTKKRMIKKFGRKVASYKTENTSKENTEGMLHSYLGVLSHSEGYKLSQKLKNKYFLG